MIDFRSVKGYYFLSRIYNNNQIAQESVIESVFNNCFMKCTNCNMISEKRVTDAGVTDGIIEFNDENGNFLGHGIMEVKRANSFGGQEYKHQLLQLLAYYYKSLIHQNYKVLLLTSSRYFSYIWIQDNLDALTMLAGKVAETKINNPHESASTLWRKVDDSWNLDILNIHFWDITDNFDFLDPITEIYNLLNEQRQH